MQTTRAWLLLAAAVLAGCAPDRPSVSGVRPNIVMIVVDTLRADRLGAYGNRNGLTPNLDEFARQGCVFERTYAQSTWTNPSVASLFTSRFVSQHGIATVRSALDASEITLASVLRDRGYATGAFLANGMLSVAGGFDRGFDEYKALWPQPGGPYGRKRRAPALNEIAFDWLDELAKAPPKPVFLYLHYVEPHTPYSPSALVMRRLFGADPPPDWNAVSTRMLFARGAKMDPAAAREIEQVYDAEVGSFDASLPGLWAELDARGLLRDAMVVFTADHGEELADHGSYGHGRTLYNDVMRVPLIIRLPGEAGGGRVTENVSLIDVAPTVLDLAGVPRPKSFQGRSLRGLIAPAWRWWPPPPFRARPTQVPVVGELISGDKNAPARNQYAVVLGSRKVIFGVKGTLEFYDLGADPGERAPHEAQPEDRPLKVQIVQLIGRPPRRRAPEESTPMDPELQHRLRAFGYVN